MFGSNCLGILIYLNCGLEPKNLEPIIIFLTDGDPTAGETDPTRIINRISEKNSGVNKASLFSLAFGKLFLTTRTLSGVFKK